MKMKSIEVHTSMENRMEKRLEIINYLFKKNEAIPLINGARLIYNIQCIRIKRLSLVIDDDFVIRFVSNENSISS